VGATVFVAARSSGSYFPTAWPLLGAAVVPGAAVLLVIGRRPARWIVIAAGALAAYGTWSLLSVAWGGLPDVAWATFDQSLIGAAALLLGSLLAGVGCAGWVIGGVVTGLTLEALELLSRLQAGPAPSDWFNGRKIQGPVGYANAQAAFLAVGVALAFWLAADRRVAIRLASGAASGVLIGTLLLTQSRGALLALAVALVAQVALSRDVRTLALVLVGVLYVGALWHPLRDVDHALVDSSGQGRVHALHHYAGFVVVGSLAFAVLAATPPAVAAARRTLLAAAVVAVLAATIAVPIVRPSTLHDLRSALNSSLSTEEPADLPGGDTRLTSLSLTGRGKVWRVALQLYEEHPAVGAGKGEFARAWDKDRTDYNESVLQPHSIELEALSELGVPGALFFLVFAVCAFFALVRPPGRVGPGRAAGVAALGVLVLQASVDWTFSFPALVVAVLLVVGALAGPGRRRAATLLAYAGLTAAAVATLIGFAGPYLSARTLVQAAKTLPNDPARAWDLASRARGYDRWSPDVVALQGQIAEASGKLVLAASLYGRAADLAQHRWGYQAEQARLLSQAGLKAESRAVCRTAWADDPIEQGLRNSVCADVNH